MTKAEERAVGILGFEDVSRELEWMPLAARRALDAAGTVLRLSAWQTLPLSARWSLIELGAPASVRADEVIALLAGVETSGGAVWTEGVEPSLGLLELVGARRAEVSAAYSALSGLERYALEKIGSSPRRSEAERRMRVAEAFDWMQAVHGEAPSRLTHVDEQGRVRMVDVSEKEASSRFARASARLRMQAATLQLVRDGATKKGDVLATARLAGIQAAKRTWELIPLCHAIALSGVELELALDDTLPGIRVEARARTVERTGVEMEALVAVSVAGLTLYDMLKAVDRGMVLEQVQLEEKSGGRLGDFKRGS